MRSVLNNLCENDWPLDYRGQRQCNHKGTRMFKSKARSDQVFIETKKTEWLVVLAWSLTTPGVSLSPPGSDKKEWGAAEGHKPSLAEAKAIRSRGPQTAPDALLTQLTFTVPGEEFPRKRDDCEVCLCLLGAALSHTAAQRTRLS